MACCHVIVVLLMTSLAVGNQLAYRSRYGGRCERITIPLCLDMKYNMTRMPNLVGHNTQAEAAMQVHEFVPLIQFGCSNLLKFFLCSLYAPMCTVQVDEPMVIPACRSMCLEVRDKCEPILQRFNFNWPPVLDCSALPERSDRGNLCIDLPPTSTGSSDNDDAEYQPANTSGGSGPVEAGSSSRVGQNPDWNELLGVFQAAINQGGNSGPSGLPLATNNPGQFAPDRHVHRHMTSLPVSRRRQHCPDRFVPTTFSFNPPFPSSLSSTSSPSVTTGGKFPTSSDGNISSSSVEEEWRRCGARCGIDVMYRAADKRFTTTWMTVLSSLSFASSLFAVLTLLVDPRRFDYPERPVIFIAFCYAFYSSAYVIRAIVGPETISCDSPSGSTGSHVIDSQTSTTAAAGAVSPDIGPYVIREGLESVWCMIIFLILYYFGTAAAVWWTLLAITWFLATARKWSREAIQSYAGYIHLLGWSLPAVQTIIVLAIRRVDADELTGMCYVGNQDATALVGFVLAPLAAYLGVGTAFISLGFLALVGVRYDLKRSTASSAVRPPGTALTGCGQPGASAGGGSGSTDVRKLETLMARIGVFSVVYVLATCCHLAGLFYQQVQVTQSIKAAMMSPCRTPVISITDMDSLVQV